MLQSESEERGGVIWTKAEIGLVMKNTRLTAGLTQAQVAKSLGRPQQAIANWEVGRSQPDANTLFELFKLLGADLNTSFGFFPGRKEEAPLYSSEAAKLAEDYDKKLDDWGRRAVRGLADDEIARCEADRQAASAAALREEHQQMEAGEMPEPENVIRFRVPEYTAPMSAGPGEEAMQEFPEDIELIREPPRGTSYIARVGGDSMEPTYYNGDMVFVHACEEIPVGRIGVFFMDGKQWIKERGDGILISHNLEYDPIPMRSDIRCQGLVLGICDESYLA